MSTPSSPILQKEEQHKNDETSWPKIIANLKYSLNFNPGLWCDHKASKYVIPLGEERKINKNCHLD